MSKVLLDMSVSLDRFVAGPNGEDGGPHVMPLIAVWLDDALYFCTGPDERKARNLARNPYCVVTTGSNALGEGFDVVIEGTAARVNDDDRLRGVAGAYRLK